MYFNLRICGKYLMGEKFLLQVRRLLFQFCSLAENLLNWLTMYFNLRICGKTLIGDKDLPQVRR